MIRFVNRARTPRDFTGPIQEAFQVEEIGEEAGDVVHTHGMEVEARPIDDPERHLSIDSQLARLTLEQRPAYGFKTFQEVYAMHPERWLAILKDLLHLLSASFYGQWKLLYPMEIGGAAFPIEHAALLRTGKVLFLGNSLDTLLWDPSDETTPHFSLLTPAATGLTANLVCGGHSFLSDGRLLVVGGGGLGPGAATSNQGWKFDPVTEKWAQTALPMANFRWYPAVVTLGDEPGRALVAGGTSAVPNLEVYSETSDSFSPVPASGGVGEKVFPQTYPGLSLLPGGEIFYTPTGFGDCSQTAAPFVATEPSGYFTFSAFTSGAWTNSGANIRTKGMSALLLSPTFPFVRVLVAGGGTAAQSGTAQTINLSTLSPAWGPGFPLLESRIHPNVVLLPDGTVFICGGRTTTGPTPPNGGRCELYDPMAGTVTEMDELNAPRHYHSVALLLPSGKVMAAGGASDGGCSVSVQNTIEVFTPPYLFRGTRPTIASIPAEVHHGSTFTIDTPDASDVQKVVFVRPMAVTHQTDSEQRIISLLFARTGANSLSAAAPDGIHPHGIAPRGYYMLFVINTNGVPSEGKFVHLH